MKPQISEKHRKELLRFLLLKTAAVRGGVKPGELLRVRHCYRAENIEGFRFCLYRKDILEIMQLDYVELRQEAKSSLILFYHRHSLAAGLAIPENRALLNRLGYADGGYDSLLAQLRQRFVHEAIPHEVGLFIGYPAKDVAGFLENLPRTPVHRGRWQVFGDAAESISLMRFYRQVERLAQGVLDTCEDLQTFFNLTSDINIINRRMTNG
ncbi:MAG: DUF3793 family protein [Victivallaceae bacterium]|nr:DUF3793 family protein [Victivallaceae bacterium]